MIQERGRSGGGGEPYSWTRPSVAHLTVTGRGALSERVTALDLEKRENDFLTGLDQEVQLTLGTTEKWLTTYCARHFDLLSLSFLEPCIITK